MEGKAPMGKKFNFYQRQVRFLKNKLEDKVYNNVLNVAVGLFVLLVV